MGAPGNQSGAELIAFEIRAREATEWSYSRKGYWRVSGSPILSRALPNAYWAKQGLKGFADPYRRFRMPSGPPDADPHVRWCGGRRGERKRRDKPAWRRR